MPCFRIIPINQRMLLTCRTQNRMNAIPQTSLITDSSSLGSITFIISTATFTVCASNSSTPSSPRIRLKRVSKLPSQGRRCSKYTSPEKLCHTGDSLHLSTTPSSLSLYACFRYSRDASTEMANAYVQHGGARQTPSHDAFRTSPPIPFPAPASACVETSDPDYSRSHPTESSSPIPPVGDPV